MPDVAENERKDKEIEADIKHRLIGMIRSRLAGGEDVQAIRAAEIEYDNESELLIS